MQPSTENSSSQDQDTDFPLCASCRTLFIQKSVSQTLSSRTGLRFRRHLSSLLAAALDSCVLCRELLRAAHYSTDCQIYGYGNKRVKRPLKWPVNYWTSTLAAIESAPTPTIFDKLFPRNLNPDFRFLMRGDIATRYNIEVLNLQRKLELEITTREDDPAAKHVFGRTINSDVEDQRTYLKVQEWLQTCTTHHTACLNHVHASRLGPTFLLDLSPPKAPTGTIRLHRVEGHHLGYVALSYKWGADQPRATTKSNLEEYLYSIETSLLPQSIQDAVTVTRKLMLRYLWVDSLCIIQDSDEHKIHELGRMESIYSNAYVTISAAYAETCNSGFLGVREIPKFSFDMPFCAENGEVGRITVTPDSEDLDYHLPPAPIDTRAWTFQESFMSPRMLIFSKYQLFWVCGEEWGKDGGKGTRKQYLRNELSSRVMRTPETSDWPEIIKQFSSRRLTDSSDKLPALSSIASYFARHTNDTYLAGLWASALLEQLCWTSDCEIRPSTWRAPSWSFMSVDGNITFMNKWDLDVKGKKANRFAKALGPSIISYEVVPLSPEAPFGAVKSGHIKICGRIIQTRLCKPDFGPGNDLRRTEGRYSPFIVTVGDQEFRWGALLFDTGFGTNHGKLELGDKLWCLLTGLERHIFKDTEGIRRNTEERLPDDVWLPWGLVLAKLENGNYHRVGYFRSYKPLTKPFQDKSPRTIVIV